MDTQNGRADDLRRTVVVGAGTMGAGIAGELARIGCQVTLTDVDEEALERGMARMRAAWEALVAAGRMGPEEPAVMAPRVRPVLDAEAALEAADLVVEAASEQLALKQTLFSRLDDRCPETTLLATNTSGLSISRIQEAVRFPGRVAGFHFWNPPHLIPLVEVTQGARTAPETVNRLTEWARAMGKRPITVRHDVPGFVGNRLQFAVFREALHILSEGIASAEDIDTAMSAGPGLRYGCMGPLRTADLGGLDVFRAISEYLFPELSDARRPPDWLAEWVEQGRRGAKSGEGFYSYRGDEGASWTARRDRILAGFLDVLAASGGSSSDRQERSGDDP